MTCVSQIKVYWAKMNQCHPMACFQNWLPCEDIQPEKQAEFECKFVNSEYES